MQKKVRIKFGSCVSCEMPNHDIHTQGLAFQCLRSCEAKNRDGTTATGFWLVDTLKGGCVKGKKNCTVTGRVYFAKRYPLIDVITNYEIRSKMSANQLSLVVNPTYDRFLYPFACSFWFLNFEPCLLDVGLRCEGMYDYIRKIPEKKLVFSPMMPSSPSEFWGFDGRHDMYFKWTWICMNKIG